MFSKLAWLLMIFLKSLQGSLFGVNPEIDLVLKEETNDIPFS
jgi:hypothetical protein